MSAASLYRSKTRHVLPDLRVRGVGLRGSVVLADHAAEYFPALHGCIERQDDLVLWSGGRCWRDWCGRWPLEWPAYLPGTVRRCRSW